MIEQTPMVISSWEYKEPNRPIEHDDLVENYISIEVMKKRASTKKGIAFRFRTTFVFDNETILDYTGEDSYVIDFEDIVDKAEVVNMLRNTYAKFVDKYEFRRLGTALYNRPIRSLDESTVDLDAIVALLV